MSENGKKLDSEKPDCSLTPASAELEEAFVWTFGKRKYDSFNWHKGIKYSRVISAMERHLKLLKSGIDRDYDTGYHHAAAIRCGAAMLIQFCLEERVELDDRINLDEETKKKLELMTQGKNVWELSDDKS